MCHRVPLRGRYGTSSSPSRPAPAPSVRHTSRVRGAGQRAGPGNDLAARFGCDAAHGDWFYGFRLAIRTDLSSRIVRAWSIVPAAVNEREVALDLLEAGPSPPHLLCGKGFSGKAFAGQLAAQGTALLIPPACSPA
jgi:hypothetical protein